MCMYLFHWNTAESVHCTIISVSVKYSQRCSVQGLFILEQSVTELDSTCRFPADCLVWQLTLLPVIPFLFSQIYFLVKPELNMIGSCRLSMIFLWSFSKVFSERTTKIKPYTRIFKTSFDYNRTPLCTSDNKETWRGLIVSPAYCCSTLPDKQKHFSFPRAVL